jgi:methylenetetrahydrofolate reductase (NADPH)
LAEAERPLAADGAPPMGTMAMRLIRDIYRTNSAAGQPTISMEFFPPKTDEGERLFLEKTVPTLAALRPDYCSVTYGAGGSTREKTLRIVDRIQRDHHLTALLHLTCVGSTRAQIRGIAEQARGLGIHNILALRGDPPVGTAEFEPAADGFTYAHQLVSFLRDMGGFSLGVAGFPEGHLACREGPQVDWDRLQAKIECGADFVLTQLFFDNQDFFTFRDYLTRRGVTVPLCPGIIPVLGVSQIQKFTALCGAKLPGPLLRGLERHAGQDEAVVQFGIDYATGQCEDLLRAGVPGIHFYTLNKARSTLQILKNLGRA